MAGRGTTITSKWVLGGEGTLRDAIPLPPALKLSLDAITWLFTHPLYPLLISTFLYLLITQTLPEAILGTFLTATAIALAKLYFRKQRLKRNIKQLQKLNTTMATVPLDPSNNPRAVLTLDRSTLIGGESGSGKSNMVWKIIKGLNEYDIPYRLHVIDPAGGVELQDLQQSPNLVNYVDRAKHADGLITRMRDDMDNRLSYMRTINTRKHVPTPEQPINVLVIDELLLLSNQLRQGVASPLGEILAVGRKAGYIVIACTQLAQVDAIGRIRDLFPQRICFAVRTAEMADAILGTHATRDGAEAHLLTRPGEGYVFAEDQNSHEKYFERFRSELITDTQTIADGPHRTHTRSTSDTAPLTLEFDNVPTQTNNQTIEKVDLRNKRTCLYELYAHDGTPMYVGIALNPNKRFKQHLKDKTWFHQVDHSQTKITWYPNRKEAQDAEAAQIKAIRPIYNILHNFGQD